MDVIDFFPVNYYYWMQRCNSRMDMIIFLKVHFYVYFITAKVIISDIYGIKAQGDLLNTPEFLN